MPRKSPGRAASSPRRPTLHLAARHNATPEISERLTELAGRTDSELTAVFADAARARAQRDGLALNEVVAAFEALGSPLMAAEAAFAAGYAHRGSGESRRVTIAFERGRPLVGRCPRSRTVSLAATDTAASLTERERRITWLAATGMSINDFAHRLNLSVRTINNRLGHVYAKLGISGRVELLSPHKPGD